ncbi:MAG: septum formation initiator family protein [Pseudomonadota bacterium]
MANEAVVDAAHGRYGRAVVNFSLKQVFVPAAYLVLLGLIAVFAHSGLQGDHGLAAFREAGDTERRLVAELEVLSAERAEMENLVRRLSDDYLDLDLLDERARVRLGMVREDEMVVR